MLTREMYRQFFDSFLEVSLFELPRAGLILATDDTDGPVFEGYREGSDWGAVTNFITSHGPMSGRGVVGAAWREQWAAENGGTAPAVLAVVVSRQWQPLMVGSRVDDPSWVRLDPEENDHLRARFRLASMILNS